MQKLLKTRIEIHGKVTAGQKLPETMTLYTVDSDHVIITAKPQKPLEERALTKTPVKVIKQKNKHIITLPPKIYHFYHLDESDYTIMASDKDPTTIIIAT